jgi:hypothetical protein
MTINNTAEMAQYVFWLGLIFLVGALGFGIATALVEHAIWLAQAKAARTLATLQAKELSESLIPLPTPTLLDALGKLIDSLGKAPAWFAMFLGGFALLWLSSELIEPEAPKSQQSSLAKSASSGTRSQTTTTMHSTSETKRTTTRSVAPVPKPSPVAPLG